jgi:diadenosine tetraphosphate (Ap4A) HIT family hydrolase
MSEKEKKKCMTCSNKISPFNNGTIGDVISEQGTVFAHVNYRPSTKAHTVIITKRHCEDLRQMTAQE